VFPLDETKYAPHLKPFEKSQLAITLVSSQGNQELKPIKCSYLQEYVKKLKEKQYQTHHLIHQFMIEHYIKSRLMQHHLMSRNILGNPIAALPMNPQSKSELIAEIAKTHNANLPTQVSALGLLKSNELTTNNLKQANNGNNAQIKSILI